MNCFVCGEPATISVFWDLRVGNFVKGGEPRMCRGCSDKLSGMSDDEVKVLFKGFEIGEHLPNAFAVLEDGIARSEEIKRRGQA